MQKKLFFFHTFALVTAMAILLAVNSGVLHVVMGYYQRRAIPAADERSQQARVVLDSWDEKDEDCPKGCGRRTMTWWSAGTGRSSPAAWTRVSRSSLPG